MATITLGSLKILWQNVSDWVTGTSASVPAVKLAGSGAITGAVQTVATAGTRIQLPNIACREVTLIAKKGNTGSIFVGDVNVSSTVYGAELEAKDTVTIRVNNANLIYVDASVSGEGVSYVTV